MLHLRSLKKRTILSCIFLVCWLCCLTGCSAPLIQSSYRNSPEPNAVGYNLPKGLVELKINQDDKNNYSIKIDPLLVPDANYLYTLTYLPQANADDNIKIEVGPNGLLKSISTTAIDKTPEIIQKAAELIPEAVKAFVPAATVSSLKLAIKNIDVIFDPDSTKAVKDLQTRFKEEVGADFEVTPLFEPQQYSEPLPFQHSVYYRLLLPYRISLKFKFFAVPDPKEASSGAQIGPGETGYYEVSKIVHVPNRNSPILSCDIRRSPFITKEQNLVFENGVLTSREIKKPSEMLGFMSIPLDVAKAIVAVPSSIVKFRIDTTTQTKKLVEAQTHLIEAQTDYINAVKAQQGAKGGGYPK